MVISLSSAWLAAALVQGATAGDSLASLQAHAFQDSLDGRAQIALARAYLKRFDDRTRRAHGDTAWERGILDTAEQALTRAARLLGPAGASPAGDSARVLRVRVWSDRALMAWKIGGLGLGPEAWGPLPDDLRLSPVLEELGENLLRACPAGGVFFTAGDADSYAAWYMRFMRGLRSDLLVVPLSVWREDSTFRARAAADLKLGRRGAVGGDASLGALSQRRPMCVSMAFERPPAPPSRVTHIKWKARPLVWVAGQGPKDRPVPPRDFVFAAVQSSLNHRDPWGQSALAVYARAARATPALCEALASFGVSSEIGVCRR